MIGAHLPVRSSLRVVNTAVLAEKSEVEALEVRMDLNASSIAETGEAPGAVIGIEPMAGAV